MPQLGQRGLSAASRLRLEGKTLKTVHKVLDRLFSDALMSHFNMKGKGKKTKMSLQNTKIYQAAVLKSCKEGTEDAVRRCAAEHLKHAPGRRGRSGHSPHSAV
ncbi:uncharacterized protein KZ484_016350 [Pholidichthys leucotaenia]